MPPFVSLSQTERFHNETNLWDATFCEVEAQKKFSPQ